MLPSVDVDGFDADVHSFVVDGDFVLIGSEFVIAIV